MPSNAGSGQATASCGSCGHTWRVADNVDPDKCPECDYRGAITVSARKPQRTKKQQF